MNMREWVDKLYKTYMENKYLCVEINVWGVDGLYIYILDEA